LAEWLKAKYYISKYRPVPIEEHLVYDNAVYAASTSSRFFGTVTKLNSQASSGKHRNPDPLRTIQPSQHHELSNPLINSVVALANETARAGYGAFIFCSSRAGCEADAILISQVMPELYEVPEEVLERRKDLLSELRSLPSGIDRILERTIPLGVAFHRSLPFS
jgi:replicative superfamily II helicase